MISKKIMKRWSEMLAVVLLHAFCLGRYGRTPLNKLSVNMGAQIVHFYITQNLGSISSSKSVTDLELDMLSNSAKGSIGQIPIDEILKYVFFFFFFLFFFSLPAMPQAFVSYEFLSSSSSGNTSFLHTSLHPILTKLGQSDQYLNHYSGTNNDGVRGHDGVTGVKNWKTSFTWKIWK